MLRDTPYVNRRCVFYIKVVRELMARDTILRKMAIHHEHLAMLLGACGCGYKAQLCNLTSTHTLVHAASSGVQCAFCDLHCGSY